MNIWTYLFNIILIKLLIDILETVLSLARHQNIVFKHLINIIPCIDILFHLYFHLFSQKFKLSLFLKNYIIVLLYLLIIWVYLSIKHINAFRNTFLRLLQFCLCVEPIRIMDDVTSYIWICAVISYRAVSNCCSYIFLKILIIIFILRFVKRAKLIKLLKGIFITHWYICTSFMVLWILRVFFLCWSFN